MITIEFEQNGIEECDGAAIEGIATTVFSRLKLSGKAAAELELVSESEIRKLNRDFRNVDKVTDVLSFPLLTLSPDEEYKPFTPVAYPFDCDEEGTVKIGSIVICVTTAKKQAQENGHSLQREIQRLFLHGLLHLLGFDHIKDNEAEGMERLESEILDCTKNDTKRAIKSGFIAVVGMPNAGKSSLINAMLRQKVTIVSPKAQTTRDRVLGILTEDGYQMIFVDTPGIHKPKNALGRHMEKEIRRAGEDADAFVYVIDSQKNVTPRDLELIAKYLAVAPVYIVLNKVDLAGYEGVYPLISKLSEWADCTDGIREIIPVSCKTGENIDLLKAKLREVLVDEAQYFDEDDLSDRPLTFMAAEIIREKALLLLQEEIPHGIAVVLQRMKENHDDKRLTLIDADIVCEKDSHKRIVIGDSGSMLKEIGSRARIELEKLLGSRVYLNLFVKVRENWRNRKNILRDVGYDD